MSTLRQAATSNKKTYQTDHPEESRYRARLIETLLMVDPSLTGKRMERALSFFDPEWETRNQDFLKRFTTWAKKVKAPTLAQLDKLALFGNASGNITISKMAGRFNLSFQEALFRVVKLASLDLAVRHPDPQVTKGSIPNIRVELAPRAVIEFVLGVLNTGTFHEDDEAELVHLTQFFAPEINNGVPEYAVNAIQNAAVAQEEYESQPGHVPLNALASKAAQLLSEIEGTIPIGQLARELEVPPGLATCLVIILVAGGYEIERAEPYFTSQYGGTSLIRIRNDVLLEDEDQPPMVEIGDLPPEQAKAMLSGDLGKAPREFAKQAFEAAQEQSELLQADPHRHGPSNGEADDLAGILDDFDGGVVEVSADELMDTVQQLEDRLHTAEELAARVHDLEKELSGLRQAFGEKLDTVVAALGSQQPKALKPRLLRADTAQVVSNIVDFLRRADTFLPVRPNNKTPVVRR